LGCEKIARLIFNSDFRKKVHDLIISCLIHSAHASVALGESNLGEVNHQLGQSLKSLNEATIIISGEMERNDS